MPAICDTTINQGTNEAGKCSPRMRPAPRREVGTALREGVSTASGFPPDPTRNGTPRPKSGGAVFRRGSTVSCDCPSWDRTRTLLIQSQACCQLHQGAERSNHFLPSYTPTLPEGRKGEGRVTADDTDGRGWGRDPTTEDAYEAAYQRIVRHLTPDT